MHKMEVVTDDGVAPPAGAWIETEESSTNPSLRNVAPPAGAWIETPVRYQFAFMPRVAPPAGAWIETKEIKKSLANITGRAPRGRVD